MSQFIRLTDLPYAPDLGWRLGEIYIPMASIVAGLRGPQGPQGEPGADADPAVLLDLQAQISAIYDAGGGGPEQIIPAVSMGSYVDGVLTYTGGQLRPGLNAAGVIINGLARLEFAGNTPEACVTYSNASMGFDELYQNTPVSRPYLMAFIGWNGAGTVAIGWSTVGDSVNDTITVGSDPFTVEFLADRVVLTVGGVEHVSSICPVPLTTPYTKFFTQSSAEVSFFTPGSGPSGMLPDETAARIAGDAALQSQINDKASQTSVIALTSTVSDVQTLAQVNQLNIGTKADQIALDALQTTVTGQGVTLASKANQTALDALSTVVSGKATPADISAAIAALVDGAPDALNTLSELAAALAGEQAQIADLLTALALRVRVDAVQSLTLAQQLQARQNIGAEAVGVAAGLVAALTPASIGAATAVQGAKADTALQSADLAPVAFSGAYSALTGLPTIPGLSSSTPAAPTTSGTAGTATTAARGDHAHPLPTSAQITAAVLTGLSTNSATVIAAADTILQALAKLQAQASQNASGVAANAALLPPVPRKIGPSWYVSGRWYDPCHPFSLATTPSTVAAGAVQFVPFCPVDTLTAQQIGIYVITAAAAGSKIRLGVYSDNNSMPSSRLYDSGDIASDSAGNKIAACTQAFTAGVRCWLAFYTSASVGVYALVGTAMGQFNLTALSGIYALAGQTGLPATGSAAVYTGAHNPRVMLQAG